MSDTDQLEEFDIYITTNDGTRAEFLSCSKFLATPHFITFINQKGATCMYPTVNVRYVKSTPVPVIKRK